MIKYTPNQIGRHVLIKGLCWKAEDNQCKTPYSEQCFFCLIVKKEQEFTKMILKREA